MQKWWSLKIAIICLTKRVLMRVHLRFKLKVRVWFAISSFIQFIKTISTFVFLHFAFLYITLDAKTKGEKCYQL